MTTEEVGAYMLLLCKSWRESPVATLPSDDSMLARWARLTSDRWSACKPAVLGAFTFGTDSRWHQKRLRQEYDKLMAVRRSKKMAAKARWNKDLDAHALHMQSIPIPSPIPCKEREEKKHLAAKPSPPPDPRHKQFFNFAYEAFRAKYSQPPTWGGRYAKALQVFLKEHLQVTLEEWQRRYRNFLASTDRYFLSQHGSLAVFAGHFDSFIDGPILEKGSANGRKERPTHGDNIDSVIDTMQRSAGRPFGTYRETKTN